jgi:hypothetical protein
LPNASGRARKGGKSKGIPGDAGHPVRNGKSKQTEEQVGNIEHIRNRIKKTLRAFNIIEPKRSGGGAGESAGTYAGIFRTY